MVLRTRAHSDFESNLYMIIRTVKYKLLLIFSFEILHMFVAERMKNKSSACC